MPTLLFPDPDVLRLALTSGVVPPAITDRPARFHEDSSARLWLWPEANLPRETLAALARLGVQVQGSGPDEHAEAVACWHLLLPLQRVPFAPPTAEDGPVLFDVPAGQFAALAAEIRRLGKRPFAFRWAADPDPDAEEPDPGRVLVRVAQPPYFALARVLDRPAEAPDALPWAYLEQAPRVWVAVGYRHPLAAHVRPPEGMILLVRPARRWSLLADGPFAAELDDYRLPAASPDALRSDAASGALPITLRLRKASSAGAAELWVIREEPHARLAALVRSLEERVLSRFTVAAGSDGAGQYVVLRVKPGKGPPPVLVLEADGYRPFLKLPNLFLPVGARLDPVPRRDAIRKALAPDPGRVVWLCALDGGRFRVESLPADAFRPLADWVQYQSESRGRALRPWKETAGVWKIEGFIVVEPEPPPAKQPKPRKKPAAKPPAKKRTSNEPEPSWLMRSLGLVVFPFAWLLTRAGVRTKPAPAAEPEPLDVEEAIRNALPPPAEAPPEPRRRSDAAERCQALEARFLGSLGRLEAKDRLELWPDLAGAYFNQNNHVDSSVCWLNAMWEEESPSALWAWGWLRAEAKSTRWNPHDIDLPRWLAAPPTPANARTLAAYVVWAALQDPIPPALPARLGALQGYLEAHEAWLPVRAAWLARAALARLARGDVLGLARTRDRLLDRLLRQGLSLDLDTPSFIRFATQGVSERFQTVRRWLTEKRELIHNWVNSLAPSRARGDGRAEVQLKDLGLEAESHFTHGYVDLLLAWGAARLGEAGSVNELRQKARQVLGAGDPVHAFLLGAYDYRIRQAAEGQPPLGPFPPELHARLEALTDTPRYCVDKLREHSRVLEPTQRDSAYRASTLLPYYRHTNDDLHQALESLPDETDPAALGERVEGLFALTTRPDAGLPLPLFVEKALVVGPQLPETLAKTLLAQVPQALQEMGGELPRQVALLDRALFTAASHDLPHAVEDLTKRFLRLLEGRRPVGEALKAFEPLTGESFRRLRRLGLRKLLDRFLDQVAGWVLQGKDLAALRRLGREAWPAALRTLLHVAAGWFYRGKDDLARTVLDEARNDLFITEMKPPERTALALAYVEALGQAPPRFALGRIGEVFERLKGIQVTGSTSTHYTLKALELVDAVVRAVVNEDFTLGPAVRGWLDDDEFLIRQRIHRDLRALMAQQEVG